MTSMRCATPHTVQRGALAALPGALQRPCQRVAPCSASTDSRSAAAVICGLAAAVAVLPTTPADAFVLESLAPQQQLRAAASQQPLLLLADATPAPAVAEATPEQQAAFAKAQETTGVKWGAYLVAWSGWLAWDVYRQQQRKEAEAADGAAGSGGGSASGGGGGGGGGAASDEAKQQ
ncbi:hypothetical protein C2E20_7271 [Micractinium conductrix]|uniref:Uncharacterized protein n=1 Tax=Micractinium conductrix TaxID=554055 RepID=A0A2P6V5D5_9CHLO|nr:hypothetical protein C2E20_7271 [Micractinium conductrix]|eukprot:PSC69299.1 hypothetical protein C2E20_7271 [Micractinium conductrix]